MVVILHDYVRYFCAVIVHSNNSVGSVDNLLIVIKYVFNIKHIVDNLFNFVQNL